MRKKIVSYVEITMVKNLECQMFCFISEKVIKEFWKVCAEKGYS